MHRLVIIGGVYHLYSSGGNRRLESLSGPLSSLPTLDGGTEMHMIWFVISLVTFSTSLPVQSPSRSVEF